MAPTKQLINRITRISIPPIIAVPFSLSIPLWVSIYSKLAYYKDLARTGPYSSVPEVYDFIVVGGGSAGAVVANRLSLHNSVLLLELGGDPNPLSYLPYPSHLLQRCPGTDLMYVTQRQNQSCRALHDQRMYWPRGLGIGGSSNLNAMIYQRGNPNDYDNWARITGNPAWAYRNVLRLFRELEDYHGSYPNPEYHGRGGPMYVETTRQPYMADYFLKAVQEKGYRIQDSNAEQAEGFSDLEVTQKNGQRWSTYPAYIKPILGRRNLRIYRYARATKIHLDKSKHAYGLTYVRHGVTRFVRARKEIILSAGSIETPKLLMLSGIGPKPHLHSVGLTARVNLPGVGQNLQDHIYPLVGPFLVDVPESLLLDREINIRALTSYLRNRTGPIATISISALGYGTTSVRNDPGWPDIQYCMNGAGLSTGFAETLQRISNARADILNKFLEAYYGRDSNFVLPVLVRPKSVGELRLANNDPFAHPIIEPNYLSHPDDVRALVEATKNMIDLYETTDTYRRINARLLPKPLPGCEHHSFRSDEYFECYVRHMTFTIYHPVGTCAMGRSWEESGYRAVVDSELRVFKTTGLRVIDASVMPVIINANTGIPAVMIGEMGSEFIRRHWAQQTQVSRRMEHYFFNANQEHSYYSKIS